MKIIESKPEVSRYVRAALYADLMDFLRVVESELCISEKSAGFARYLIKGLESCPVVEDEG